MIKKFDGYINIATVTAQQVRVGAIVMTHSQLYKIVGKNHNYGSSYGSITLEFETITETHNPLLKSTMGEDVSFELYMPTY